ncbi:hypothetical protein [Acidaminococcus fermentans]|uniref:hypothetical protein n=1 Tax=Acidaminococcus fermentans TaxID=905 RepID=UPI000942D0DF|nr:hypothetical protein [Acidaminococcus fermentans]
MKKERDAKTIKAEMQKEQEKLKKKQEKIRSLNAELTTAKKREKARRYGAIGSAIEETLGVGELSAEDLRELVACLKRPIHLKDGSETTTAVRLAHAIEMQRAKVSAGENPVPNGPVSADQNREAVPGERQGFTRPVDGSPLPSTTPAKP